MDEDPTLASSAELMLSAQLLGYMNSENRLPTLIRLAPDVFALLTEHVNRDEVDNFTFFNIKVIPDDEVPEGFCLIGDHH